MCTVARFARSGRFLIQNAPDPCLVVEGNAGHVHEIGWMQARALSQSMILCNSHFQRRFPSAMGAG